MSLLLKWLLGILTVLILTFLIFISWRFFNHPNPSPIITPTQYWQTYNNDEYGFQVQYPADWEVAPGEQQVPVKTIVLFGHPLNGKKTYVMYLKIHDNPDKLDSRQWVEEMLTQAQKDYESKARPDTIKYESKMELTLAGLPAYELYGVFDFDQTNEQIYLAKDTSIFEFSFPIAQENSNLSEPVENNKITHEMLSTFEFN